MYNDPSGNFIGVVGASVSMSCREIMRNSQALHVMGMISGMMNTILSQVLNNGDDPVTAFTKGYLAGLGFGAVYYGALAIAVLYEVTAIFYAVMDGIMGISGAAEIVLSIICFATGNNKEGAVYACVAVFSLIGAFQHLKMSGLIKVRGPKGGVAFEVSNDVNWDRNINNTGD